MGKKVLHIPYRDSILTKLLQSALGGNSRTVLVKMTSLHGRLIWHQMGVIVNEIVTLL